MLWEDHFVNSSRMLVKRIGTLTNRISQTASPA